MEILEDINTADHFDDHKQMNANDFDKPEKPVESLISDLSEDGRYVVTEGSEELMF